jgi:hypothetical protein
MSRLPALLASLLLVHLPARAQDRPEMADGLRADGKIWVVVGVILIVLAGLLGYLIRLDRRIGRAERRLDRDRHA